MAAKLFVFVACLALSQARLVRRDATDTNLLQDIEKHAAEFQKTFSEQFAQLSNSENTENVKNVAKEGFDSILQQISAFSNSLQKALGDTNGKAKEALEQTRQDLERKTEELRRQHPDVEQQASALRAQIEATVQHALQATQNLAKEVASNVNDTNEKLAPQLKAAYDDLVKQAESVGKKIHDAAKN